MKLFLRFFPVLAILVFLSCKEQPTAPTGTATVKGQVVLATDEGSNPTPPYSGIQVSLEGTSYSTMTDDSGLYEFDGIPGGTYNVRFSKPGYGDIRWFGMTIQGGGNAPIYWYDQQPWHNVLYPTLFKISDLVTTLRSAPLKDTINPENPNQQVLSRWLVGQCSGTQPGYYHLIAVYFSHHSDVSSSPGQYEYFEGWWGNGSWYPFDTLNGTFQIPIDFGYYRNYGFNSGDSVYVATYGAPQWGQVPYYDYYDPSIRQGVLTSINQTPSPVVGFKIP
jgi:hypothetical protein